MNSRMSAVSFFRFWVRARIEDTLRRGDPTKQRNDSVAARLERSVVENFHNLEGLACAATLQFDHRGYWRVLVPTDLRRYYSFLVRVANWECCHNPPLDGPRQNSFPLRGHRFWAHCFAIIPIVESEGPPAWTAGIPALGLGPLDRASDLLLLR